MNLLLAFVLTVLAQSCPEHSLGSQAILHSGDIFEGRAVEVFQRGWFDNGTTGYVVRTLTPPLAHLGATGCELEASAQPIQPTQRSLPVMNDQQQMLYTLWSLTAGQSAIYGNAIGLPGGNPNAAAQANLAAGFMTQQGSGGESQYQITQAGIAELQRIGAIE